MALNTTAEALHNRNQVLESFEKALNTNDSKKREQLMTFIIVGAGAAGIELAGALAEMRKFILPHDYPDLDTSTMRIILIDGGPRLLSAFSPQSSEEVKKYLHHLGVAILFNQQVKNYENNMLLLDDGNFIESDNVYWVAGVKANSLAAITAECYGPGNRLRVNEYNQIQDFNNKNDIGHTELLSS